MEKKESLVSKMQNHVDGHIMHNICGAEDKKINAYGQRDLQHKNKMNCNRSEKILIDSVAWMAALQVHWREKIENSISSPSHQIALIIMNTCSTKMLQFPPIICHAPRSQYTILFVPCHS